MHLPTGSAVALFVAALGLSPATAQGQPAGSPQDAQAESVYLSLAIEHCALVETFEYDMGGIVDCGRAAGYGVRLVDSDLRQRLILDDGQHQLDVDPAVTGFNWLGPMVEFRGHATATGFDAHALIVRVHVDDGTGTGREIQRLLVAALDETAACQVGWIDAAGNPDHNLDARILADTAGRQGCANDSMPGSPHKG